VGEMYLNALRRIVLMMMSVSAGTPSPPLRGRGASGGEERSDERKIVSYSGGQYATVDSLQPSALVQS